MGIKTIGGCGTMGTGIVQVAAQADYDVIVRNIDEKFIQNALMNIDNFLSTSAEKGKMTAEAKDATMGRIKGTTRSEDLADADYMIEAAFEDIEVKKHIFGESDKPTRKDVILGTNTSSVSITELAKGTHRPDKVVGVNRLMILHSIEAMKPLEQGVAAKEDIDKATKLDLNYPMGPFELMDLTG